MDNKVNIPVEFAANWLCQMAAADGVVSAREKKLLTEFATHFGLDANNLIRKTYAIAKRYDRPEVEAIDPRALAGRQFEEFVVSLCSDKKRFKLMAWRGDKISGSTYAQDTLLPDLHVRHRLDAKVVEYFVECKYRSSLKDDILDLTGKLGRYRSASVDNNMELFIALGVGGTPSNPDQFFFIPSRMIKGDHVLHLSKLTKCLCSTEHEALHNYIQHFYSKRVFKSNESI